MTKYTGTHTDESAHPNETEDFFESSQVMQRVSVTVQSTLRWRFKTSTSSEHGRLQPLVAALSHDRPVEFSVGAAKAEAPPTAPEWETLLASLS